MNNNLKTYFNRVTSVILSLFIIFSVVIGDAQLSLAAETASIDTGVSVQTDSTEASFSSDKVLVCTNMKTCYKYFHETLGYNLAVTCAILANIQVESDFRPKCVSGDGYYGLVQWSSTRKKNLIAYCKKNDLDYTTVKGQLRFINYESKNSYSSTVSKLKNNVDNTELGAVYASWLWSRYYEVCATSVFKCRQSLARMYWDYFTSSDYIDPATVTSTDITFPDKVSTSDKWNFSGEIKASGNIEKLIVGVARYTGYSNLSTSRSVAIGSFVSSPPELTVEPDSKTYEMINFTDTWSFGSLSSGSTYTFYLAVIIDGIGYTVLEKNFKVVSGDTQTSAVTPSAPSPSAARKASGIRISWSSVTDAVSYNIYRKTGSGSYSKIGNVSAGTTSYLDTSAVNGKTYTYAVTAVGDGTESKKGATSAIRFISAVTPKVSNKNYGVLVSWSKIGSVSGYYIWKKTGTGSVTKVKTVSSSTTSWKDTSVANNKKYTYYVTGYYGSVRAVRVGTEIVHYTAPAVSLSNTAKGIKLSWEQVNGATGYIIYRKAEGGTYSKLDSVEGAGTTTYTDEQVVKDNGALYYYAVRATDGTYSGGYSGSGYYRVTQTTLSGLTNVSTLSMKAVWEKNPHADGYQIEYAANDTFTSGKKFVTVSGAATLKKTIGSLKKGNKYYVRVRAYIKNGSVKCYSAWTETGSVTIKK